METPGQNRGYHEFESVTLSDVRCVEYLIRYRSKIYPRDKAARHFSDIMVLIYVTLDQLIRETVLTKGQKKTISHLMDGYTSQDLSEMWGITRQAVDKQLRMAALRIAETSSEGASRMLERRYHNCLVG